MNISDFNHKTHDTSQKAMLYGHQMKPSIVCNDGFTMSVQGSSTHYCSPRSVEKDYYAMEIGFPSYDEPLIHKFMDGDVGVTDPTDTVYGYVPADIIDEVIVKHGGINEELTFAPKK